MRLRNILAVYFGVLLSPLAVCVHLIPKPLSTIIGVSYTGLVITVGTVSFPFLLLLIGQRMPATGTVADRAQVE